MAVFGWLGDGGCLLGWPAAVVGMSLVVCLFCCCVVVNDDDIKRTRGDG